MILVLNYSKFAMEYFSLCASSASSINFSSVITSIITTVITSVLTGVIISIIVDKRVEKYKNDLMQVKFAREKEFEAVSSVYASIVECINILNSGATIPVIRDALEVTLDKVKNKIQDEQIFISDELISEIHTLEKILTDIYINDLLEGKFQSKKNTKLATKELRKVKHLFRNYFMFED